MMKAEPVCCNMLCHEQLTDLMLQGEYFCAEENWALKPRVHRAAKLQPEFPLAVSVSQGRLKIKFTLIGGVGERWFLLTCAGSKARRISEGLFQERKDCSAGERERTGI